MASIYLIRHGQASFGSANYDKLSELGCRQAKALGTYFNEAGIRIDASYSGGLERQQKTAALAMAAQPGDVQHTIDHRFDEIRNDEQIEALLPALAADDPELKALAEKTKKSSKDYQKILAAVFNHWVSEDCHADHIQSWADYSGNVTAAISNIMRVQGAGRTLAVFTSGGTIATIVAAVLGIGHAGTYQFYEPVINCSITQLLYSGKRISLSRFNDHSYLETTSWQSGENFVTYR